METSWPAGIVIADAPVRRVHTRARRRSTQLVLSRKPLDMLVSESSHEELFHVVAELDTTVTAVRAQPCTLRVPMFGRISRQTPDAAVIVGGQAEIHEIKEAAEFARTDVRAELLEVRDEIERRGRWRYSVTLDTDLRTQPLLHNVGQLWRCLGDEYSHRVEVLTRELLDEAPLPIRRVIRTVRTDASLSAHDMSWEAMLSMICDGVIDYDVTQPLTLDSLVWTRFSGPPRARILPFRRPLRDGEAPRVPISRPFLGMTLRGAP
jgi:hypothetical protein